MADTKKRDGQLEAKVLGIMADLIHYRDEETGEYPLSEAKQKMVDFIQERVAAAKTLKLGGNMGKYKHGQVWQAAHPMCWEVRLIWIDTFGGRDRFIVVSTDTYDTFHRTYNNTPYLFTPVTLNTLLGEDAELLDNQISRGDKNV